MASAKVSAEDKIKFAMTILTTIVNDAAVPRNIRRAAAMALTYLRDTRLSPGVRAANARGPTCRCTRGPRYGRS